MNHLYGVALSSLKSKKFVLFVTFTNNTLNLEKIQPIAKLFYSNNIFINRNTAKGIWYWWKTPRIFHSIVSPDD